MVELGKLVVTEGKASIELPIQEVVLRIIPVKGSLPIDIENLNGKVVRVSIEKVIL